MTSPSSQFAAFNSGADTAEADSSLDTVSYLGDTNALPEGICQRIATHNASTEVGDMLGKYLLIDVLGHGGMGVVFSGFDPMIERNVAIKLLPEELADDDVSIQRFLGEAKAVGKLNHPNVVSVFEIDHHNECPYMVMEFLNGGSTDVNMRRDGAYSPAEGTRIIIEACKGLQAAHDAGMIHRDIKPGNLLLTQRGEVKLADFGLVKSSGIASEIKLTLDDEVMGTPYFMSPEQCQSEELDARSDIYALGATYYSLLTAKQPYADHGVPLQIMFAHCDCDIPDPREHDQNIPAACVEVMQRAMAKEPKDRYQTAAEMQQAFEAALSNITGTTSNAPAPPVASSATLPQTEIQVTPQLSRNHTPRLCPHAVRAACYLAAACVVASVALGAAAIIASCW